jgi:hypothetical protein
MLNKVLIFLYVVGFYFLVFLDAKTVNNLRGEDGLIENMGAFFFLTASVLFFLCYRVGKNSNETQSKKKYFYLFFAGLFFIGFGEEISWGQRLMNWETPQLLQEINKQKETNFHNLKILGKGILRPDIWFFIFWFSYCLVLPTVNKYSSESRNLSSRFGLPVPPLWVGYLLLTNFFIYIIPQFFSSAWHRTYYIEGAFLEIMESNAAFIFAVFAFYERKKQLLIKEECLEKGNP